MSRTCDDDQLTTCGSSETARAFWRDLRGRVASIDTKVCKLYLLTGEYDFSCTPEDTRRTAAAIGGASVTIMERLGHFPMSEHPEQFRRTIAPVLADILTH